MAENITKKIVHLDGETTIARAVSDEIEAMKPLLGFKSTVDANKKKIMISQTLKDKPVADTIYKMLLFNSVPKENIV